MAAIEVKIKNIAQIKRAFARAPFLMTRHLNIAIGFAVANIGRDSKRRTPVDTGRLYNSTYWFAHNLKGEVGTKTNYDIFVHEGTRFMRARPYLRKAVNAEDAATQRYFKDAVDRTLDQIGKAT